MEKRKVGGWGVRAGAELTNTKVQRKRPIYQQVKAKSTLTKRKNDKIPLILQNSKIPSGNKSPGKPPMRRDDRKRTRRNDKSQLCAYDKNRFCLFLVIGRVEKHTQEMRDVYLRKGRASLLFSSISLSVFSLHVSLIFCFCPSVFLSSQPGLLLRNCFGGYNEVSWIDVLHASGAQGLYITASDIL